MGICISYAVRKKADSPFTAKVCETYTSFKWALIDAGYSKLKVYKYPSYMLDAVAQSYCCPSDKFRKLCCRGKDWFFYPEVRYMEKMKNSKSISRRQPDRQLEGENFLNSIWSCVNTYIVLTVRGC